MHLPFLYIPTEKDKKFRRNTQRFFLLFLFSTVSVMIIMVPFGTKYSSEKMFGFLAILVDLESEEMRE